MKTNMLIGLVLVAVAAGGCAIEDEGTDTDVEAGETGDIDDTDGTDGTDDDTGAESDSAMSAASDDAPPATSDGADAAERSFRASARAPSCVRIVSFYHVCESARCDSQTWNWKIRNNCDYRYTVSVDVARAPDPACRSIAPGYSRWFSTPVNMNLIPVTRHVKRC